MKSTAKPKKDARSQKGGRPSISEAKALSGRILEAAAELFLEHGFKGTSTDQIADVAGVTKRTLYARYPGKAALFEAAITSAIDARLDALELSLPVGRDIRSRLIAVSEMLLRWLLTDRNIAMERVVSSEALRFPALARNLHAHGFHRAAAIVEHALFDATKTGEISLDDPAFAADYFMTAVILPPFRRAGLGFIPAELDDPGRDRIRFAVDLFLDGCRRT
ncbi:TetR/AcrR family transcriptional regulator [Methylocella silvestris]|uniref:TetR family transcriptional regulator n=1 Tax=Methylocella silvestris TaxID=199596 RepID=A0A2J7TFT0_METSI|nr:TetR/AcrR family transcriptional regulator [Methylocella silvestris]PNG25627.1 TetR family transcriptional regulator [Methylocella silvestris]